jgi:hypothetical protein
MLPDIGGRYVAQIGAARRGRAAGHVSFRDPVTFDDPERYAYCCGFSIV